MKIPIESEQPPIMISEIYWLIPEHVLYWKMSGHITSSEICGMSQFIPEQVKFGLPHKLHILIDAMGLKQLDYANQEARDAFYTLANQRWMGKVVVCTRNYQIQVHLNALSSAFGLNWYNVTSLPDAIRFLKRHDNLIQNVPDLQPASRILRPEQ